MASIKDNKPQKLQLEGKVNSDKMTDSKRNEKVVEIDSLRQFTIPKMRKTKQELFEIVPTNSVQYQREVLQFLQQSYIDRKSVDRFVYTHPKLVHSTALLNEFMEKRKAMRQDRSDKELQDTYGFLAVKSEAEMKKYCTDGVKISNSSLTCLGNPTMGVYLCKHADLLQPSPLLDGQTGFIVIFKIIRGKAKMMVENRVGEPLEPTPDFDCHLSKNVNIDMASVSLQEAYESSQLYIYEYTEDLDVTSRPRQVIPYAVISFRYMDVGSPRQKSAAANKVWLSNDYAPRSLKLSDNAINSSHSKRPSTDSLTPLPHAKRKALMSRTELGESVSGTGVGKSPTTNGEIVWSGQLCLQSTVISDVDMVSYSGSSLPWNLEPWLSLDHDHIGYDEITTYYQLELLPALPRMQECRSCGKFFNYCELRPMNEASRNFLRVINLLRTSKFGSRIKLVKGVDLIIVPHCRITYRLGLSSKLSDPVLLHCIFISTMSSTYLTDGVPAASNCQPFYSGNSEVPVSGQLFDNGADLLPFQEKFVNSHSVKPPLHFALSHPWYTSADERTRAFLQPVVNSAQPFPGNAHQEFSAASTLGQSSDVPFSLSKLRHYDPRLTRRQDQPFDHFPSSFGDDCLILNPPISDAFSTSLSETSANGNQNQNDVLPKRHDSLQERIERMQAEMEAKATVQSDVDTDTEYSPLPHHLPLGSSSSSAEDDEELELDIIKLRRHTALGQSSEKDEDQDEPAEMDEGNLSDDLVDEIVRMKPLQAKAARETVDGVPANVQFGNGVVTSNFADKLSVTVDAKCSKVLSKVQSSVSDSLSNKILDDNPGNVLSNATGNAIEHVANDHQEKDVARYLDSVNTPCLSFENGSAVKLGVTDDQSQKATIETRSNGNVPENVVRVLEKSVASDSEEPDQTVSNLCRRKNILSGFSSEAKDDDLDNAAIVKNEFSVCAASDLQEREVLLKMVDLLDKGLEPDQLDHLEALVLLPDVHIEEKTAHINSLLSSKLPSDKPVIIPVENHHNVLQKNALQSDQSAEVPKSDVCNVKAGCRDNNIALLLSKLHQANENHLKFIAGTANDVSNALAVEMRSVTFEEKGKLSVMIKPDKITSSAVVDDAGAKTTQLPSSFSKICNENVLSDCIFTVLHRKWIGRIARRNFERVRSEEDEKLLEMVWTFGLHFLPFFLSSDDDDFRLVNVLGTSDSSHSKTLEPNCMEYSAAQCPTSVQSFGSSARTDFQRSGHESDLERPTRPSSVGAVSCLDLYRDRSRSASIERSYPSHQESYSDDRDGHHFPSRSKNYRFRDDRFHPYSRRQYDPSTYRAERREFYKVYREHSDFDELLQCLTSCNFKYRCTRPILADFDSLSSSTAPGRFSSNEFRRSSFEDADFILGQREKVDDCLEDLVFGKDQIPDFDAKKAIADVIESMFKPAASALSNAKMKRYIAPDDSQPQQEKTRLSQAFSSGSHDNSFDNKSGNELKEEAQTSDISNLLASSQVVIPFLEDVDTVDHSSAITCFEVSVDCKGAIDFQPGKMEVKWPPQLATVDIPSGRRAFRRLSNASNLLELVSAEIISSCDPRQSSDIPPTSVYSRMDFGYENASQQHSEKSVHGLADDDWLFENIGDEFKEMAKNLKVRVHINPKFLPILADRAALAKRDSVVTTLRSEPFGESGDIFPSASEQDSRRSSAIKSKALLEENDFLQNTTKGEVDVRKIKSKSANEQQNSRSNEKLNDVNEESQDHLFRQSQIPHERIKQAQIGVSPTQSESTVKNRMKNSAADLAFECTSGRLQKVQSLRTEYGSGNETNLSDCATVVKPEKESLQSELPECFISPEAKTTSTEVKKQALKSIAFKVVKSEVDPEGEAPVNAGSFVKRQDKQKLKEEVLLLEKMVAEKKAQQEERENRDKIGSRVANKTKPVSKIFHGDNREIRKPRHGSTSSDRLIRSHALVERHATTGKTFTRKRCIPTDGKHKVETKLEHEEGDKVSNKAAEKLVNDDKRDEIDKRSRLPVEKMLPPSSPALNKGRDQEISEDLFESPVIDQHMSSCNSETLHLKNADSNSLSKLEDPPTQFSKLQAVNAPGISDSRSSHSFDADTQIYKEPQHLQSPAVRYSVGFNQSGRNLMDRATAAKNVTKLCGTRFCTCDKLKTGDKLCDDCTERLSSASSDPLVRPLLLLSSHSAKLSSSDSSVRSAGRKSDEVIDAPVGDFPVQVEDVQPIKELENFAPETNESVLLHLSCLSPETQFESQFYDCFAVRSIHLEVIREWMKQKPLELLICGRLKINIQQIAGLPDDVANDPLVVLCLMEFCTSADLIVEESSVDTDVKEETGDSTEILANSLFEEVRQHLEFLSEKSVVWTSGSAEQPDPRENLAFDTEILRLNVANVSRSSDMPKASTHHDFGSVVLETDALRLDVGRVSVDSKLVPMMMKQEGDVNGSHKALDVPRKKPVLASQVQKFALPSSEENESKFKSSHRQALEDESLKGEVEEPRMKKLDGNKLSWQNVSSMQDMCKKEMVCLDMKEEDFIETDLHRIGTVRPRIVGPKRRHSPAGDTRYSSSNRNLKEQASEPELKLFKNASGDISSRHNLKNKDELSGGTAEKQDSSFDVHSFTNVTKTEKIGESGDRNVEHDLSKEKHRKEKKKSRKKKAESEELKSDLLLAKPVDSKVVLSHLLSEESALVIGMNTDSNSSFQNNTIVEEEKPSGRKEDKLTLSDSRGLLKLSDNLPNESGILFSQQESTYTTSGSRYQAVDSSEVVQMLANVIPVSNFDSKGITPETSFNWAMTLAMTGNENDACSTDAAELFSHETDLVFIKPEETVAKSRPSKRVTLTTPRKAVHESAQSLFKSPAQLQPATAADGSSSNPVTIFGKCQSVNGKAVENLAQDAFTLLHSEMDVVFVNECSGIGSNSSEKTVLLPIEFQNNCIHYSLLSPIVVELYKGQVQGIGGNDTSNPDCSFHVEAPEEPCFKSGGKRKLSASEEESGEWCKKPRDISAEKMDTSFITGKNMDGCTDIMPSIAPTWGTCLSTDGCADEERDGDFCDMFSMYSFEKGKKVLPDKVENLQNSNDLCEKSNVVSGKASLKDDSSYDCQNVDSGMLLQSSKGHSIQQQFLSAKGPRFMQTFRQNQIAKRKSQKENLVTATGGKILHSKQSPGIGGVVKPKAIGMTLEETLAVLSSDRTSVTASTCLASSGSTVVSTVTSGDVTARLPSSEERSGEIHPNEADTASGSSAARVSSEDLDAIPLPTSVKPEELLGSTSKASKLPATSSGSAPVLPLKLSVSLPCENQSSLSASVKPGVSVPEVVNIPAVGNQVNAFLSPPMPCDKPLMEDSANAASGNAVSSIFIPPAPPNAGPPAEWNCQYFPPAEAPVSYAEQLNQSPVMMPPRFPLQRPFLVENATLMTPRPLMQHDVRAHCAGGDPRSWENIPPMQPPFSSAPGPPWRGPWPPKNMMMPPEMSQPHFCPPPPGMDPSLLIPKRPLLLRPSGNRPGLLPHPGAMPPPPLFSPPSFRDRAPAPVDAVMEEGSPIGDKQLEQMNSAANIRMYIFNKDKLICKSIERFLEFNGAHSFDPYNVGILRNMSENVCTVFVHEADLKHLHNIPNLLRLKRDIRVTFACYKDVMDIKFRNYVPLFPSAGLVVIDDAALIACKSESLQMLCDFMQLETKEKKAWTLIITPKIMEAMDKIRTENSADSDISIRLSENKQLLDQFKLSGVVQEMSGNCLQPVTSLDYSAACRFLQTMHCKKFRHFIFITDFLKSHPDAQLFLGSGIDIMTIPQFLKAFVGKSVEHDASAASAYSTRLTADAFEDLSQSTAIDSINYSF